MKRITILLITILFTACSNNIDSADKKSVNVQHPDFEMNKEIAKKFKEYGATIIGGCCETRPSHIEAMAKIK